jgi:hypothetical protein
MPIAIAALLGLAGLLIVIYPLLGVDPVAEMVDRKSSTGVSEQEVSAKQSLRDVDFDRRLGNLDEEDYRELRDRFEESALAAMKSRYERERELDAAIDRQLQAFSAERPTASGPENAARSAPSRHVVGASGGRPSESAKAAKPATSATPPTDGMVNGSSAPSTDAATRRAALRKRRGV